MARYNRIKRELTMPLKINEINSIVHQVLCMHDRPTERTQKKRECYTEHGTVPGATAQPALIHREETAGLS